MIKDQMRQEHVETMEGPWISRDSSGGTPVFHPLQRRPYLVQAVYFINAIAAQYYCLGIVSDEGSLQDVSESRFLRAPFVFFVLFGFFPGPLSAIMEKCRLDSNNARWCWFGPEALSCDVSESQSIFFFFFGRFWFVLPFTIQIINFMIQRTNKAEESEGNL